MIQTPQWFSFALSVFFVLQSIYPSFSIAQSSTVSSRAVETAQSSSLLKGMIIHPDAPLAFDFLVDVGNVSLSTEQRRAENEKMVRYFFAALAIPEQDMWVNLSPYEKDRIIPEAFGKTEMGQDLLEQDYQLKQLTARLMSPDGEIGRKFWDQVYAQKASGQISDAVETFNKVWIVPQYAKVAEHQQGAFVLDSHLNVMLEEDYLAQKSQQSDEVVHNVSTNKKISEIFRQTVLPEIEKEVNAGGTFAKLRQIYNAMILAVWYKRALKQSFLGEHYANQSTMNGIAQDGSVFIEGIYQKYLDAFQKGNSNLKEDYDSETNSVVLRQYFSGGVLSVTDQTLLVERGMGGLEDLASLTVDVMRINLEETPSSGNQAMLVRDPILDGLIKDIKDSKYHSFGDISLEAFFKGLGSFASGALGKGGLGFLTGDTWGAYHRLRNFRGFGAMPLYAKHYKDHTPIDWDHAQGIQPVILDDGNPLTLHVSMKDKFYDVKVYWINQNGMPVFLFRSDEVFETLYPNEDEKRLVQYAFLGKCFVDLMYRLEIAPDIVRLSESQLLFVQTAMEHDRKVNPKSLFNRSKVVFTTHTPERAGIPTFWSTQINILRRLVDGELFEHLVVGDSINTIKALTHGDRVFVINSVSKEHQIVTGTVILPDEEWRSTGIQNGSAGDTWRGDELNELIKEIGLKDITGQQLFDIKSRVKTEQMPKFLQEHYGETFADPTRPLIGMVRRLVEYKRQDIILPYLRWIVGDPDQEFEHPLTKEKVKGLGANVFIGGHALDDIAQGWKRQFEALAQDPELKGKFLYVPETGIDWRKIFVIACDLWLSVPEPTREASGTSDEAAAMNGTLNIATATGGPLAYIKHNINGWLIDVFPNPDNDREKVRELARAFDTRDPWVRNQFLVEGGRQLAQYIQEALVLYRAYVDYGHPRWIEMMERAFIDSHNEVSIEVMIQKYGLLFESVLDGTGAAGYEKKQKAYDQTQPLFVDSSDNAQLIVDGRSPVGGIDLDSRNMDFDVDDSQGHVILPGMPQFFTDDPSGFQPVIVNVQSDVPVLSLVNINAVAQ